MIIKENIDFKVPDYQKNGLNLSIYDSQLGELKSFAKTTTHNSGNVIFLNTKPMSVIYRYKGGSNFIVTSINADKAWGFPTKKFIGLKPIAKILNDIPQQKLIPLKRYAKVIKHGEGVILALRGVLTPLCMNTESVCLVYRDERMGVTYAPDVELHEFMFQGDNSIWNLDSIDFKDKIIWQIHVLCGGVDWNQRRIEQAIKQAANEFAKPV